MRTKISLWKRWMPMFVLAFSVCALSACRDEDDDSLLIGDSFSSKLNNTAWIYYKLEEYDANGRRIEDETEFYNDLVSFYSGGYFESNSWDWEDYEGWYVRGEKLCFRDYYYGDVDAFTVYSFKDKKEMVLRMDFDYWEGHYHEQGYELFYFRYHSGF